MVRKHIGGPSMSQQFTPPRLRSRAGLAVTAIVACGALALSGCKSAVNSEQSDSGPQRGGTLNIVQSADIAPATFMSQNNPNFSIIRTVFNTLTAKDHHSLDPQPELA